MLPEGDVDVLDRADGVRVAVVSWHAADGADRCAEPQVRANSACIAVAFATMSARIAAARGFTRSSNSRFRWRSRCSSSSRRFRSIAGSARRMSVPPTSCACTTPPPPRSISSASSCKWPRSRRPGDDAGPALLLLARARERRGRVTGLRSLASRSGRRARPLRGGRRLHVAVGLGRADRLSRTGHRPLRRQPDLREGEWFHRRGRTVLRRRRQAGAASRGRRRAAAHRLLAEGCGHRRADAASIGRDHWPSVVAADICRVLVRGEVHVASPRANFVDCDGLPAVAADARAREAFWRRVAMQKCAHLRRSRRREGTVKPRAKSRGTVPRDRAALLDDARHGRRVARIGDRRDPHGRERRAGALSVSRRGQRAHPLQPDRDRFRPARRTRVDGRAGPMAPQGLLRGTGRGRHHAFRRLAERRPAAAMSDRSVVPVRARRCTRVPADGARLRSTPSAEAWLQMQMEITRSAVTRRWRRVVARPF